MAGSQPENSSDSVRLDAWLWSVRIFKTRTLASAACRKGQVKIRGVAGKPARQVRLDDEISVERAWITLRLRVTGLLSRRVGAKLVADFCEDITSEAEIEAARERARLNKGGAAGSRQAGAGRPTKKDRRELEGLETPPEGEDFEDGDDDLRQELFERWTRRSGL